MGGRTHPHAQNPPMAQLDELIGGLFPMHRDLYLAMHGLVLETVPEIGFSVDLVDATIGYGARQYGYDGWGMAALMPHKGWLSLVMFKGTSLPDPRGLLEGTGASVRHVKLRSLDDLNDKREALVALLDAATTADGE